LPICSPAESLDRGDELIRTSKLFSAVLLLLTFSLLTASQIRADGTPTDGSTNYVYEFDGNTFTWEVPTNPVITPGNASPGNYFTLTDLSFSENGVVMVGTMDFYNTSMLGGFDLLSGNSYLCDADGPQLYTGPENAPTLLTGNFSLLDFGNGYTATYGNALAATTVPEPSTLSLLAVGLALGLALTFLRKN
jgi:outer membrane protein assembly factor BamB